MSSYKEGQMHQLADRLEAEGFTSEDVTKLGQYKDYFGLRGIMRGTHEIREIGACPVPEPTRSWREEDGVIYFSVTSDGTTGGGWIVRLESKGSRVGSSARRVLHSTGFKPTSSVTTEVAILKGMLFEDNDRTTEKIRAEADKRKLAKPNAELVCLICEKFTGKEIGAMGLRRVVAARKPIIVFGGTPCLLGVDRYNNEYQLGAYHDWPDHGWSRDDGFAFIVSRVSSRR